MSGNKKKTSCKKLLLKLTKKIQRSFTTFSILFKKLKIDKIKNYTLF